MNFRKLLTYLTVGTAAVIPFAGAQNPTILQGSYISNVFGNSNFVLNPNAQTNIANVTTVTATVSRSTTTPLVATSEFTVAIGTANGTATWATRTFDQGMKGQNCEARFSYRGFAATSKVHIKQGANTVASLNLTPATDPRIASINFPCGDLSTATTFQVTDTAILGGTNEIGGIYVGLATNMANVAQAELVGMVTFNNGSAGKSGSTSTWTEFDAGTWTPTVIGQGTGSNRLQLAFSYLPAGRYFVSAVINPVVYGGATASHACRFGIQETTSNYVVAIKDNAATPATTYKTLFAPLTGTFDFTSGAARTFKIVVNGNGYAQIATGNCFSEQTGDDAKVQLAVYRFPSASELVVTPERQNTFAAAQWTGAYQIGRTTTAEITISNAVFATNRTLFGKAEFTATANDVAIKVPQMPPGTYRIELTGNLGNYLNSGGPLDSICNFYLKDGINTALARSQQYGGIFSKDSVSTATAIVRYTSTADRTFTASLASGNTNSTDCYVVEPKIIITPLDQPSNSALYVQGPVLGAQTGAAIPEGYVNEFATRSISDSSLRQQATPVLGTVYYPWTGELTLPAGNWNICYRAAIRLDQSNSATNVAQIFTRLDNKTDGTNVFNNATWPTINNSTTQVESVLATHFGCQPIAITTSKVFRVGIQAFALLGTPTVGALALRGDLVKSELYAIRLN